MCPLDFSYILTWSCHLNHEIDDWITFVILGSACKLPGTALIEPLDYKKSSYHIGCGSQQKCWRS